MSERMSMLVMVWITVMWLPMPIRSQRPITQTNSTTILGASNVLLPTTYGSGLQSTNRFLHRDRDGGVSSSNSNNFNNNHGLFPGGLGIRNIPLNIDTDSEPVESNTGYVRPRYGQNAGSSLASGGGMATLKNLASASRTKQSNLSDIRQAIQHQSGTVLTGPYSEPSKNYSERGQQPDRGYGSKITGIVYSPPNSPDNPSLSPTPGDTKLSGIAQQPYRPNQVSSFNTKNRFNKNQRKPPQYGMDGLRDFTRNNNFTRKHEFGKPRDPKPEPRVSPNEDFANEEYGRENVQKNEKSSSIQRIRELTVQSTPAPPIHIYKESTGNDDLDEKLGIKCEFEKPCKWTWETNSSDSFRVVTGEELKKMNVSGGVLGPSADPAGDDKGHFLHTVLTTDSTQKIIKSPDFSSSREKCVLEVFLHQSWMMHGSIRIVIEPVLAPDNAWVVAEIMGNDLRKWKLHTFDIDRVSKEFRILFEVSMSGRQQAQYTGYYTGNYNMNYNSYNTTQLTPVNTPPPVIGHISIDNLRMRNCFADSLRMDKCSVTQLRCNKNKSPVCVETGRICDITIDCDDSEDELFNCDKIPFGGRCDFEQNWCGWQNSGKAIMEWQRHSGPTPTEKTGPESDHTYQHTNMSGYYMFVNMNQHAKDPEKKSLVGFASNAVMNSVVFNPPPPCHSNTSSPYRNTCVVRFFVHQFGMNAGSINLSVVEMKEKENITTTLWWSSRSMGDKWVREELTLPNITSKYFLQFEARMGMRIYSDVAIDDFSLSPECFGYNIPKEHLQEYNYWDPRIGISKKTHADYIGKKFFELTSCSLRGITGPTPADCDRFYNGTDVMNYVRVSDKPPYKGAQVWKVPNEGYYTIIAKGASGGLGSGGVGSSRGAIVLTVLELHKNEEIYVLVGQSGEHACIRSMVPRDDESCGPPNSRNGTNLKFNPLTTSTRIQMAKNIVIENGAGGGGGGSFVFLLNQANAAVPLLVAGGGGGLGIGRYIDNDIQQAQGIVSERSSTSGQVQGDIYSSAEPGGPGGGWQPKEENALNARFGASLFEGARGGLPCYNTNGKHGQGGFGGGGGGCNTGGGGGGYAGGDTLANGTNGEGGTSYLGTTRSVAQLSFVYPGANSGTGNVIIIPAIQGCGCDYRCVALDEFRSLVACICPDGWRLRSDNLTACELIDDNNELGFLIGFLILVLTLLIIALGGLILMLYNRYQRKKQAALRHKMLLEQDLQLSRLRATTDDSALTNFNPNYGCDGILNGNVDVKSLPQVARESLRLVKALGQGAFGEVYQGLYRHRDGDAVEMPVAVKTLPEMSTGQAESDFLMEAAIMAKFNHPNIVHLIGVCFDRHPRFIVLELLAGGDLKNFLREGRNKPERPSPLTMKDLIYCALDVAKGCRYMESKRFIHRDIAARNCLLSSKGPGRVVKIADFGMARDIYRSDYYRKGGKAMLPIKWMPPEAFLDGIFTSKTDVWSFGVLLWEVFSLGLMPYTGLPNRDVMQLVTGGGRLDAPQGCPMAIYRIMADCWNPTPEDRPTFSNLLERLTACTQDPDVMNAPLPSFLRPPSSERDTTIMRPPGNDDFCLQVPNSSDYLIPLPGPRSIAERLLSEATGVTIPDTLTTYTVTQSAGNKMNSNNCWETSFMIPHSKTNQPLLNGGDGLEHPKHPPHPPPQVDRLISLDTPQQTPTTIQPPISFSNNTPTSDITTNTSVNATMLQSQTPSQAPPPPQSVPPPQSAITLDPAALGKQQQQTGIQYANIKMHNPSVPQSNAIPHEAIEQDKIPKLPYNGTVSSITANGSIASTTVANNNNNLIKDKNQSPPFSIQGYVENYKENHSEISC